MRAFMNVLRGGRGGRGFVMGSPARTSAGVTDAAMATVMAATVLPRESSDSGPRVAVISVSLGGGFFFEAEEAERRIRRAYPELSDDNVRRIVRQLETRVKQAVQPPRPAKRESWVHGWGWN
jgi:hypothetical protein